MGAYAFAVWVTDPIPVRRFFGTHAHYNDTRRARWSITARLRVGALHIAKAA